MVRFKTQMDGLKERLAGDGQNKQAQLKKACQNFEAVFIGKLWKQMKSTVPKEGYLHSKQEDSYMGMFDREFSEKMAQAGGIGLADMIYAQLNEKLKETSKTTLAGGIDIRPLNPQPMELNRGGTAIELDRKQSGMTLEDWGGKSGVEDEAVMTSEDIAAGLLGENQQRQPLTDIDVKAKLEELARHLESQRIREGIVGSGVHTKGYMQEAEGGTDNKSGRKLAEIG